MLITTFRRSAVLATALLLGLSAAPSIAADLVYTPVNPNFGGSPFNAAGLLASAEAQKKYKSSSDFPAFPDVVINPTPDPDPPTTPTTTPTTSTTARSVPASTELSRALGLSLD
ncbi:MAG: curli assembly protein CsgF [Hyphomicrobiaceae bacterium]